MEGRFITTDSDLAKSFLFNDGEEVSGHFLRRIESPDLFWLNDDIPGPAKKTFQTTSHTISSGNPSIKRSRAKSVIFPFFSSANDLS
jgi:hypothetical protein